MDIPESRAEINSNLDGERGGMRRILMSLLLVLFVTAAPALAQTVDCPEFEGITCDGWVTDAAGVLVDDPRLEEAVGRVVAASGHEIAVVVIGDSGGRDTNEFARDLGNAWGVGDPERNDGIVVVVNLGSVTAQGVLRVGGLDRGRKFIFRDELTDERHERDGEELERHGLFVRLEPNRAHVFAVTE